MRRALLAVLSLALVPAAQADAADRRTTWKLASLTGVTTAKVTNTSWFCRRTGGEGSYITSADFSTDFRMRRTRGANIFGYPSRGALVPFGSATPAFTQTTTGRTDWSSFDTSSDAERPCEPQPEPTCAGTYTYNTTGLSIDEGSFAVRRKGRRSLAIWWPLIVQSPIEDCSVQPNVSEFIRWRTTIPLRKWKGRRITIKANESAVVRDVVLSTDAKYDVQLTFRATARIKRRGR